MKVILGIIIGLVYFMMGLFIAGFCTPDSVSTILIYVALGLGLIIFALLIANVFISVKKGKNIDQTIFKTTMVCKLILIPFYIFNFVLCIELIIGGIFIIFTPFLPLAIVIAILIIIGVIFTYLLMVSTGCYNIIQLFRFHKELGIDVLYFVHIVLHFIFIVDVIDSIYLYKKIKNENRNVIDC